MTSVNHSVWKLQQKVSYLVFYNIASEASYVYIHFFQIFEFSRQKWLFGYERKLTSVEHSVWKSREKVSFKYFTTLQAERATFMFIIKIIFGAKIQIFEQVALKIEKNGIFGKKIQLRHFWWYSNIVVRKDYFCRCALLFFGGGWDMRVFVIYGAVDVIWQVWLWDCATQSQKYN